MRGPIPRRCRGLCACAESSVTHLPYIRQVALLARGREARGRQLFRADQSGICVARDRKGPSAGADSGGSVLQVSEKKLRSASPVGPAAGASSSSYDPAVRPVARIRKAPNPCGPGSSGHPGPAVSSPTDWGSLRLIAQGIRAQLKRFAPMPAGHCRANPQRCRRRHRSQRLPAANVQTTLSELVCDFRSPSPRLR